MNINSNNSLSSNNRRGSRRSSSANRRGSSSANRRSSSSANRLSSSSANRRGSSSANRPSNEGQAKAYFIYGRFQPFTLGHNLLLDKTIEVASQDEGSQIFLFVSYKKTQPKYTPACSICSINNILQSRIPFKNKVEQLKPIIKEDNTIMDSPLSVSERIKIICEVLGIPAQKMGSKGIYTYTFETSNNPVSINIINTETHKPFSNLKIDGRTITMGGFLKCPIFIEHTTSIPKKNIFMLTGSDRESKPGIKSIVLDRNNTDASLSFDPTKLSGSKIRCLALLERVNEIKSMYQGCPLAKSDKKIKDLIIKPIKKNIYGYQVTPGKAKVVNDEAETSIPAPPKRSSRSKGSSANISAALGKKSKKRSRGKRVDKLTRMFTEIDD